MFPFRFKAVTKLCTFGYVCIRLFNSYKELFTFVLQVLAMEVNRMKKGKKMFRKGLLKYVLVLGGMLVTAGGSSAVVAGCSSSDSKEEITGKMSITGVSIPTRIETTAGSDVTLTGKGFEANDVIKLISVDGILTFRASVKGVTARDISFALPEEIVSGSYNLWVVRQEQSLMLGSVLLNLVSGLEVPDKAGMTVKGMVTCDGKPVAGVVVSDGYEVTATDAGGVYYLASQKKNGMVFISVPGGYEVVGSSNFPSFYQYLSSGDAVERKDFSLTKVDNTNHILLAMADMHLANRNDDLSQFNNGFVTDVNAVIASYQQQGKKVYGLTLGDESWELYWYSNNFALPETMAQIARINCPVFNVMGNHDNEPYTADDWKAAEPYRKNVGPTYFSFNLGRVHYVVLDDIEYLNSGASEGVIGSRNYNGKVVTEQLEWLKKDLATITDKSTPLVVAMHIPLHDDPTKVNASGKQTDAVTLKNGSLLLGCLADFREVHILSGHTHINFAAQTVANVMEHNTAAVCATWWWTGKNGYAGNHICKDGTPGGYGVWEMQGNDMKWYYKSIGYDRNYQFRAYDLNKVHITAAAFAPNSTDQLLAPYAGGYASPNTDNEVLINVWGYDEQWKVEVTEAGKSLEVKRVVDLDPLHIISYEAKRLNVSATPTESFNTNQTAHLFKAKSSSAQSTLQIKVTDRFGNVYTETMERPKAFQCSMK